MIITVRGECAAYAHDPVGFNYDDPTCFLSGYEASLYVYECTRKRIIVGVWYYIFYNIHIIRTTMNAVEPRLGEIDENCRYSFLYHREPNKLPIRTSRSSCQTMDALKRKQKVQKRTFSLIRSRYHPTLSRRIITSILLRVGMYRNFFIARRSLRVYRVSDQVPAHRLHYLVVCMYLSNLFLFVNIIQRNFVIGRKKNKTIILYSCIAFLKSANDYSYDHWHIKHHQNILSLSL